MKLIHRGICKIATALFQNIDCMKKRPSSPVLPYGRAIKTRRLVYTADVATCAELLNYADISSSTLEMQKFLEKPSPSPDRHRRKFGGPTIEPRQNLPSTARSPADNVQCIMIASHEPSMSPVPTLRSGSVKSPAESEF